MKILFRCLVRGQLVHTFQLLGSFSHLGQNSALHPIIPKLLSENFPPIPLRLPHHAHSIAPPDKTNNNTETGIFSRTISNTAKSLVSFFPQLPL